MKNLLSEKYVHLFETQIIYRGKEYYKNGFVKKCLKTPEGFISKITGSDNYTVKINLDGDNIEMSCTCPYGSNCKHEYATLLAIDSNKFKEIKLMPKVVKSEYNFINFIKSIPEIDLKNYILKKAEKGENYYNLEEDWKCEFFSFLPKDNKEYFYNEIFNLCLIEDDLPLFIINDYIDNIKKYIDSKDYRYSFIIYSSLIDALCDSNIQIFTSKRIELYSKIGIFARISYRKGNDELKGDINNWIKNYETKNYNGDVYLEDLLLTIR